MKITATQLRRIIKEEVEAMMPVAHDHERFLHGFESGHPMDDEGYMVKSRMADIKEMAEVICNLLDTGDQLPAWVQDLVASSHTDLEHVKDYLVGDEKMRSYEKDPVASEMPLHLEDSESHLRSESHGRRGGMLLEGHARITPEEMAAWMTGDWGFVSESTDEQKRCEECGAPMGEDDKECAVCAKDLETHRQF